MVHETVTTSTMLLNAGIQLVNLIIFFAIFYYFLAGPVVEAVEKRKKVLEQFKNADEILQKKLKEAEEQKAKLIEEGVQHKNKLIQQAKQEAEQIKTSILEQAEREKQAILEKAKVEIQTEKEELEREWEKSVKQAVLAIYQKLVGEEDEFVKKYIENVKNFK